MASMVTSRVAKHILKENAKNAFGSEDPYFDYTPVSAHGRGQKLKKTKKAAPPGLTSSEQKILKKVTRRAYRLDNCFSFCGIKVGWGAIVGIIPGLGDVFDVLMALMVYRTICQVDIPPSLRARMMLNIMIDFGIGLVPILGDVADAVFRANTRNAALLYGYLRERGAERIKNGADGSELVEKRKQSVVTAPPPARTHHAIESSHEQGGIVQEDGTVEVLSTHHAEIAPVHDERNKTGGKSGWMSRFTGGGGGAPPAKKEGVADAGEIV